MLKLSAPMEISRKIKLIKRNSSENGFWMKKLWLFEEKLLKKPKKFMNVRK